MPQHYCPMCGSRALQMTHDGNRVCTACEASVRSMNSVTIILPRPTARA